MPWKMLVQPILIIKKRLHSIVEQDTSFPTSATLDLLPIVACCGKDFWGGRGSYVASGIDIHMYLEVGTTHFYHLALRLCSTVEH